MVEKLDSSVGKGQSSGRYFVQLLTCTQPDDLRLRFVQLQVIVGHPVTDPLYTGCKPVHGIDVVSGWCADLDLRVVGIRMTCETTFCNDVEEFGRIQ